MAGVLTEDSGVGRSEEGILSAQSSQSGEALAEWRSSEQVEKGTPSTSPPYWGTDDDDDDEDGGVLTSSALIRFTQFCLYLASCDFEIVKSRHLQMY